ncbi:unnamed protein product, partial [Symbiodinium necroappetens]
VSISQPVLAWSAASFQEISTVTISFTVQLATIALRAMLISLPPGFQHRVRSVEEFKVSNQRLPLLKGSTDWLDVSVLDRILISLEPEDPAVDVGTYMFSFPVEMPVAAELPSVNLWQLSFCNSRYCVHPKDEAVLVSFPLPGFLPGEVSLLEQRRQQLAQEAAGRPETASASRMRWSILPGVAVLLWP